MTRPALADVTDPVMAQRWQVKAHLDGNTCDPCRDNNGKTYRNRGDAYKDYPDGSGFKNCVGAKYGNKCRCTVVKRTKKGGSNDMTPEQIAALNLKIRTQSEQMSARAFAGTVTGPTEKLTMRAASAADDGSGATQVFLYDYIGGWDGVQAADVVLMLAGLTGPVDLHINSGGGSIFEGAAIHNAFLNYGKQKGTVTSYIDGVAASAASFIALAASPYDPATNTGGVVCEATASLMTHDGQGGAIGTADMLREVADLLDMLSDTIADIYARKTGTSAEEWRETMRDGDSWFNAVQGKKAGLVDRIANGPAEEDDPDADPPPADSSNLLDLNLFAPDVTAETGWLSADDDTPPNVGGKDNPAPDPAPAAVLDLAGIREALGRICA